jgi:hypothetical protein
MDTRTWRRSLPIAVALAVSISSCGEEPVPTDEGPVTDDLYVSVMTELLLLDASPPDGESVEERNAAADSARAAILHSHGLTAPDVLRFAETVGGQPARMEEMWQRITHDYDSIRAATLRRETEARSEAEGKLGSDARSAAETAVSRDSAARGDTAPAVREPRSRSRLDSLRRQRRVKDPSDRQR